MSEQLKEALSAVVDGEASEFELRRVLDEMGKDDGLTQAWQSYHLIRQAAQNENVEGVVEMGERIWASLDADDFLEQDIVQEEPLLPAAAAQPGKRWGLVGGALAAALALGVFVTGNFDSVDHAGQQAANVPSIAQTVAPPAPVDELSIPASRPTADSQLNRAQTVAVSQPVEPGLDSAIASSDDDFDYGPGFVPYSEMNAADQARSDAYFIHHVQHQAVNNDNVLSFMKMISYPQ